MSSIFIVLFGIAGMCFGWFVYSKFVASKIFRLEPEFVTPAHEFNDGTDYVPTNKFVLWGHHFTSVAGAAPIVGPAIAVYWGWLPAILWVVFGTIFFAGIHDMGALWASTRHKGKSMGALSETVIGRRTRFLFMVVIFLVLLMVNAVFGVIIARAFVNTPSAVFPAWMAIVVALVIGQLIYRKFSLIPLCIVGVAVLYGCIYIGGFIPFTLPESLLGLGPQANWIVILFIYAGIASLLPVWVLLQPRDFINGVQLFIGLIFLYGAVFLALPDVSAPAINPDLADGTPPIVPILFVTIACGAISGFHGLVSSGTSSKQLDKEPDARPVGYLGAVGEGSLAVITIVAVTGSLYAASTADWHGIYTSFTSGGANTFIAGGANLIAEGWGLPTEFATTLLATMVILFAATTMDSGVRLQRYIIQEWGEIYDIAFMRKGILATVIAVVCCLALAFGAGGSAGDGGMAIWPLFGSTNQILASLSLLVMSVLLIKLGRPAYVTLIPMTFVLTMAIWAGAYYVMEYIGDGRWHLVIIDFIVLIVSIIVLLEALSVIMKLKKEKAGESAEATGEV